MKRYLLNRMAWIGALAMLFGVAPAVAATAAYAAPAAPAVAPAFNLNGAWTDNGTSRPVINVSSTGAILIDMSAMHRPNATGTVLSSTTAISVTFPDDATYTGSLVAPNLIRWSNGSTWEKVFTGATVFNLNGDFWSPGVSTDYANGFVTVEMSALNRPDAVGFAINSTTIEVTFPDDATYTATIDPTGTGSLHWSNGSTWTLIPIF
jgi:hypothetical protein